MFSHRGLGAILSSSPIATLAFLFALSSGQVASAAISSSGSVSPSPPNQSGADPVVGVNDIGRMTITAPSGVTSDVATIGGQLTGIGYVAVSGFDTSTGSAATWTTNDIIVGHSGTGTLEVLNGAVVSIDFLANPSGGDLSVGLMPDSVGTVLVSGRGSLLRIGNDSFIGHNPIGASGSGTLIIENEGYVIGTNDAATGEDVFTIGALGRVELNNGRLRTEFLTNNGAIVGGGRIDNEMTISNGVTGRVEVGSGKRLVINGGSTGGVGFDNDGEVVVLGGEIQFLEQLTNTNAAASLTLQDGVAHFPKTGFGFDSTAGVLGSIGGTNHIYGTVRIQSAASKIIAAGGSTAVFHEPVTNSGGMIEIFPGSTSVYLQGLTTTGSGSALAVHLTDADGGGSVEVAGGAALDGVLQVQLASGFVPANGDEFQILTASGGITGSLSMGTAPALAAGLEWNLEVNSSAVVLSVVSNGDYNGNGAVDTADYVLWRKMLNQSGQGLAADGNGNGTVDLADYDHWRSRFGNLSGGGLVSLRNDTVPEPTSAALMVLALCSAGLCNWRRGRRAASGQRRVR